MDTLAIIKEDIREILVKNGEQKLSDCLDMVQEETLTAIYNMVCDYQANRVQKQVVRLHVMEDIAAALEGREAMFSKGYIPGQAKEA